MRDHGRHRRGAARRCLTGAAVTLLGAVALAVPAPAQVVSYAGSVQATTGEYFFSERTTSFALFNGLSVTAGRLRLGGSLPLLYQNSTALTWIGGVPVPTGGPDAAAVRERQGDGRVRMGPRRRNLGPSAGRVAGQVVSDTGYALAQPGDYALEIGDPLLEAGLDLYQGLGALRSVGVQAMAKAPLASVESGVGTGAWDYGAGASMVLGGDLTQLYVHASYWAIGDLPDLELRDSFGYAVSLARAVAGGRWSVLGSVSGATPIVDNADAPLALGLGLSYLTGRQGGLDLGVSVGLTESSPDVTSWIGWRATLGGRRTRPAAYQSVGP